MQKDVKDHERPLAKLHQFDDILFLIVTYRFLFGDTPVSGWDHWL